MIVCSCNILSDTQIRTTLLSEDSPRTPSQVYRCLGCVPRCGVCARTIRAILRDADGVSAPGCPGRHNCPIACEEVSDEELSGGGRSERSHAAVSAPPA